MEAVSVAVVQTRVRDRVLELDVLRGLSILMVVIFHSAVHPQLHSILYLPITLLNRVGWSGVDIFFVLSGYLVGGLLMREYQQTGTLVPKRFIIRRGFKVWPTYYVFLLAFAFSTIVLGSPDGPAPDIAGRARYFASHYWSNFLHVQNYAANTRTIEWLWSLAVEEHFYLVLPFALTYILGARGPRLEPRAIARRMTTTFVAISLSCLALRAWGWAHAPEGADGSYTFVFPTQYRLDSLFCGVFLAYLTRFHAAWVERLRPYRHLLMAVGALAWVPYLVGHGQLYLYPLGFPLLAAGASALVISAQLAATSPTVNARPFWLELPMRGLAWLGVRSYAIYVWHGYFAKPVGVRILRVLHFSTDAPGLEGWGSDLVMFGASFLVGNVMYHLVELPGLKLRQRLAPAIVPTRAP